MYFTGKEMNEQIIEDMFEASRTLVLTAVFLVSLSGLILEISITRIFSAAIWYHHAFLAVSVALLGLGSSGLFLHFTKYSYRIWATKLSILASISIAVSIPIILLVMRALASQVQYVSTFLVLSAIPFFFIGLVISTSFNTFAHIAGKLYFADLLGASFGSLVVIASLILFGGESTTLLVGVVATVAGVIFAFVSKSRRMVIVSSVFVIFACSLVVVNNSTDLFSIPTHSTSQKDLPIYLEQHPEAKIVKTEWNSFSRIDVVEGSDGDEGLAAKMFIDGGAGMNVLLWDGNPNSRKELTTWIQYLPFRLVDDPKVLVIGSGGGRDVVAAMASGSKDITSVEINPIIFHIVDQYGSKVGNVYKHPYVDAHIDEGRSFVTRLNQRFDVIYIPFVDTWASVSSGGLSLSENYLYTMEGFQEYYNHLSDTGIIVVVRWLIDSPRLVSTFVQLLEDNDIPVEEARRHLVIVTDTSIIEDPSITVVIFSKKPFSESQIDFLGSSFETNGYKPILLPNRVISEPYNKLFNGDITLEKFYSLFEYRVHPVTDDSPYFLTFEKPLPEILIQLLYASVAIVAVFVFVPMFKMSPKKIRQAKNILYFIPYFAALGIGFMLIEVALLQKMILLIGNPTSTLAVLLFTLLLSGGLGSLVSTRIMKQLTPRNLVYVICGIAALILVYTWKMESIISAVLPESIMIRISVSVIMLSPLGFILGMPFPTGIRIVKTQMPTNVPWMWSINGGFSVFGAVLATIIGIMYGLSWSMISGVAAYSVALVMVLIWKKKFLFTKAVNISTG